MNLEYKYWVFPNVLSHKFCNEIRQYGIQQGDKTALVGGFTHDQKINKKQIKNIQKIRNSNVAWLDDKWIYRAILPYVYEANKMAKWNFEINAFESCQFTKYGPGQYYGWHCDSFPKPFNKPNVPREHGKIRKLSVTCSLSDPSEYMGGELEFNFNEPDITKKNNIKKCTEVLPKGSIVVFPSFVWHRVCPVQQGIRYSLVIWNLGYPYK
jgi:PKHD-type hydroxylase